MLKMNIKKYIPQREPFIMVDKVICATADTFETHFLVKEDMLFLENNCLSEAAVIENIAQTCAAGMGYYREQHAIENNSMGFIGSINKLEVFSHAFVGETISTKVHILHQLDNILLIEGVAQVKDRILVKGQMKIVI